MESEKEIVKGEKKKIKDSVSSGKKTIMEIFFRWKIWLALKMKESKQEYVAQLQSIRGKTQWDQRENTMFKKRLTRLYSKSCKELL